MSEVVYDSKYLNDAQMRDYNIFAEEYFSGSDIKLTANNTVIKQISMIQFELQEQLKPIYGYGSYVYDDIAVGSRIVTGSFVCPMKNLAENEEFKCSITSSSYISKPYTTIDTVALGDKSSSTYTISLSNEPVYLSNAFDIEMDKITDDSVLVKREGVDFLYVYSTKNNVLGFIKK